MPNYKIGFSSRNYKRPVEGMLFKDLYDLDQYTTKFKNEAELKIALLDQQYLTSKDVTCNVRVLYNHDKKVKEKIVFYKDMANYLDIHYLRAKILSYATDIDFLKRVERKFNGNKSVTFQLATITKYMEDTKKVGYAYPSDVIYNALSELFKRVISREIKTTDNTKKREYEVNYSLFRDLATFVYKYDNHIEEEFEDAREMFEEEDPLIESYKGEQIGIFDSPIKEPKKEEKASDGLFDPDFEYNPDVDEDDFEEPLFPPNSEEEKRYNAYMDSLPYEDFEGEFHKRRR